MEKSPSRPLSKRTPLPGKKSFNLNVMVRPRGGGAKRDQSPDKVSREDISRCINIWASMYLTSDESIDARDLLLPSPPWTGRDPSGLKRFE